MGQYFLFLRFYRCSRGFSITKHCFIILLLFCSLIYIFSKIKLLLDYHNADLFDQTSYPQICRKQVNSPGKNVKIILFWTTIFSSAIDPVDVNNYLFQLSGRCGTDQCRVTINREELCQSDAVIFHARGGIKISDMPRARRPEQRYVLLTKEPPYKTTAIIGHLNNFFNWTATYRTDSDIDYRYFHWQRKNEKKTESSKQSYLNNRSASAAAMISNCYSQNNREDYITRLNSIIPITRLGYCSGKKCSKGSFDCLDELALTYPFYLAFENSLCRDYVTEKYANVISNGRMIPVVFAQNTDLYIPHSYIDANQFPSPEHLGRFLLQLVKNTTAYDSYFQWKNDYELTVVDDFEYLCELCRKLNDTNQPVKIYTSMRKWLYEDAKCQRWISHLNRMVDISVDETMDYEDPWF